VLLLLSDGVHELDAALRQGLLAHREALQGARRTLLKLLHVVLEVVARREEALLDITELLGVRVEGLGQELLLDVRLLNRTVRFFNHALLLVSDFTQLE